MRAAAAVAAADFCCCCCAPRPHPAPLLLGEGSTKKAKSPLASALADGNVCVGVCVGMVAAFILLEGMFCWRARRSVRSKLPAFFYGPSWACHENVVLLSGYPRSHSGCVVGVALSGFGNMNSCFLRLSFFDVVGFQIRIAS